MTGCNGRLLSLNNPFKVAPGSIIRPNPGILKANNINPTEAMDKLKIVQNRLEIEANDSFFQETYGATAIGTIMPMKNQTTAL